jgi:uncharacterized protein YndB with AHSA1/START domain
MAATQIEQKHAVPDLMLSQTRVIRAPRARVFAAWTDPQILMQWFGPPGRHCPSATMDLRVGGRYRIEIRPDTPPEGGGTGGADAEGEFLQIVPDELLQFTWIPSFNPGENTVVTIQLKDVPGGTELTLVHERFASESSREGHNNGWAGSLVKLAALLEA